jgi:hypothetical protein
MASGRRFSLIFPFLVFPWLLYCQNAPVSTLAAVSTYNNSVVQSFTVTNFNNIGSGGLKLLYDASVALAIAVTTAPGVPGNLSYNVSIPGEIVIGWFNNPAISLPNGSTLFNITFSRMSYGITAVSFYDDDGYSCEWGDANAVILNDIPFSSYYHNGSVRFKDGNAPFTKVPTLDGCSNSLVEVPVKVSHFIEIGKFTLTLHYDNTIAGFQGFSNTSGFPGLNAVLQSPGNVQITGNITAGNPGVTLADSSVLVTLSFYNSGGNTPLAWIDNGPSCSWAGIPPDYLPLNDIPQLSYYMNGSIANLPVPGAAGPITGPLNGLVCPGSHDVLFSVNSVPFSYYYLWNFPQGFTISDGDSTNQVYVDVGLAPQNGNVTVTAGNPCGNGSVSVPFPVVIASPTVLINQPVTPPAVIAGTGTATFSVEATGDSLHYQWQESGPAWVNLNDGGVYSGVLSAMLTISQPPLAMNGLHYRCLVDGYCAPDTITDGTSTLIVGPFPGIRESTNSLFEVYPNPVDASTIIKLKNHGWSEVTITVRDWTGHLICDENFTGFDSQVDKFPFPCIDLPSGIYILSVDVKNSVSMHRLYKNILVLPR